VRRFSSHSDALPANNAARCRTGFQAGNNLGVVEQANGDSVDGEDFQRVQGHLFHQLFEPFDS
jgi:hypothetical protein